MERVVFVKSAAHHQVCIKPVTSLFCVGDLLEDVEDDCYIVLQGKVVDLDQPPIPGSCYFICSRLRGGKGGFGSMLRAIGAQIEKTTNREACRDLSGRRMRDVNNEKKMVDYLKNKAEQEREREKKKMEKLERLTQKPKHFFNDPDYDNKLHEAVENVDDAVKQGFVAHTTKRKMEEKDKSKEEPKLKKGLWLGEDDISSGDSDSENEEDAEMRIAISQNTSSPDQPGTSGSSDGESGVGSSDASVTEVENPGDVMEGANPQEPDSINNSTNGDTKVSDVKVCTPLESGDLQKVDSPLHDGNTDGKITPESSDEHKCATEELSNGKTATDVNRIAEDVDLTKYSSANELESLGLEVLKSLLMKKGVKCGGSIKERADRLLAVKDLPVDKIDQSLLAAAKGKRRKRSRK